MSIQGSGYKSEVGTWTVSECGCWRCFLLSCFLKHTFKCDHNLSNSNLLLKLQRSAISNCEHDAIQAIGLLLKRDRPYTEVRVWSFDDLSDCILCCDVFVFWQLLSYRFCSYWTTWTIVHKPQNVCWFYKSLVNYNLVIIGYVQNLHPFTPINWRNPVVHPVIIVQSLKYLETVDGR